MRAVWLLLALTGCLKELEYPADDSTLIPGDCTWYLDADGDGFGDPATGRSAACEQAPEGRVADGTDCDDSDSDTFPGAPVACDDADRNCDAVADNADGDGDGHPGCEECDDADPSVYPGAPEVCDGADQDCDGEVDEDATDAPLRYVDADGDGHGSDVETLASCEPVAGYADVDDDCDDGDAEVHPGADERCDGRDEDCDGEVDEDAIDPSTWYTDADADGYGAAGTGVQACEAPSGTVDNDTDCDDGDARFNPGASEADCTDPADYNCDGSTGYVDGDGDGFAACEECDDTDAAVHPDASEACDGVDNDCDGSTDEPDAVDAPTWYADADSDGYGDPQAALTACAAPNGYVADDTDCDDQDASIHPTAPELCNGEDDDCDGQDDEGIPVDANTWYADGDGDGFGDVSTSTRACTAPDGYVADASDCDDSDAQVYPAAPEYCNGGDDNCNGQIDEGTPVDAPTWYADADSDSYGNASVSRRACNAPSGYVSNGGDCDDADPLINPGATEACNGVDDDCVGGVDDGFADTDGDGTNDCLDVCPVYASPSTARQGNGARTSPYSSIASAMSLRGGFCDEIVLMAGTYAEVVDFGGQDLEIRGEQGAAATILTPGVTSSTSPVVRFTSGESQAAVLEDVTITGGTGRAGSLGTLASVGSHGGGVYISGASPTLRGLIIQGNGASTGYGGGLAAHDFHGVVESSTIRRNSAAGGGGGVALTASNATFSDVIIEQNEVSLPLVGTGGGLLINGGAPLVQRCTVQDNISALAGGLGLRGASATVKNNLFLDNETSGVGVAGADTSLVLNNTIYGGAKGVECANTIGQPTTRFTNNILAWYRSYGVATLGCTASTLTWTYNDVYSTQGVDYSGMSDQDGANGNLDVTPGFTNRTSRVFTLTTTSAVKDAGTNLSAQGVVSDFVGATRPQGSGYAMGAYER